MYIIPVVVQLLCHALLFCDHINYSPPGSSVHGISRQENWSGLPVLSPRGLPNPGIKPPFSALSERFFTSKHYIYVCVCVCVYNTYIHFFIFTIVYTHYIYVIYVYFIYMYVYVGFSDSSVGKESACSAGDPGSIPES